MADENVNSQAQTPQEPQDIAQAFQMVRENQQAPAEPVEPEKPGVQDEAGTSAGPGGQGQAAPVAEGGDGDTAHQSQASAEPAIGGGAEGAGGYAATQPQADYDSLGNGLMQSLQKMAMRNTEAWQRENEIVEMNIGSLYERREDGTVIFNNPDNPNRPFESREQAQAWINSFNQQIMEAKKEQYKQELNDLYNAAQPALRLIEFAPIYDAMDSATQDIFDTLIDPYAVTNANGDVIGFDCNLAAMARQAMGIVEQYGLNKQQSANEPQQQQQQQQEPAKTPAMDLKSGSSISDDDREPTNLEEAMAMLNKRNKEKRNGN